MRARGKQHNHRRGSRARRLQHARPTAAVVCLRGPPLRARACIDGRRSKPESPGPGAVPGLRADRHSGRQLPCSFNSRDPRLDTQRRPQGVPDASTPARPPSPQGQPAAAAMRAASSDSGQLRGAVPRLIVAARPRAAAVRCDGGPQREEAAHARQAPGHMGRRVSHT
jgi:hypothetical protein